MKIDIFSVSIGIFGFFFYRMLIELSSTFHMSFDKIAEMIGCQGVKKCNCFKQMLKNILLGNQKVDNADTFHTRL